MNKLKKEFFYSNKKLVENRGLERNSNLFGMNTRDDNVFKKKILLIRKLLN